MSIVFRVRGRSDGWSVHNMMWKFIPIINDNVMFTEEFFTDVQSDSEFM